jgi:hypothetical protein
MKHVLVLMTVAFSLVFGMPASSDAQTVCAECGSSGLNNFCCPVGAACTSMWPGGQARCGNDSAASTALANGGCCLDGSFLPGAACSCNEPPDCSGAAAGPDYLWPPNHKFVDVWVVGVTDPDGDPVTITVDAVSQDEPTQGRGLGAGNSCPDGQGIGTDVASVRAERSGNRRVPGNGRVYHIDFTADDGLGGTCSGTVTVCVLHDRSDATCVDDGPLFDSTACN